VDQFYFESGYVEASYFAYIAQASSDVTLTAEVSAQVVIAVTTGYYIPDYIVIDYYQASALAEGSAVILSSFAVTSAGNKIRNVNSEFASVFASASAVNKTVSANAVFTAAFTQTGTISHIEGADLFAFSNAAISVQVSRIRSNNIAASAVFDVATDFVVKRNADADVDSIFSAIINGLRSRDTNTQTQAAFSFDATVRATKVFASAISSQSSVSLIPNRLRNNTIDTVATATTSATGLRIRSSAVNLADQFSVDVTARKYRDAILTGTGVAVIECLAVKTARASSSQQAQFTQTALAGKIQPANAIIESFASILVSRNAGPRGRPRNLIDNFVNSSPGFSTNAKFGSHSLSSGNNFVGATNANNFVVPTSAQSFYLEMWHYPTTSDTNYEFFLMFEFFTISQTNTGKYKFQGYGGDPNNSSSAGLAYGYTHTVNHTLNQWNHLAIVKQGNSLSYYINGTRVKFWGYPTTTDNPNEQLPFYGWGATGNQSGGVYGSGTIRTSNISCRGGPYLLDEVFFVHDTTLGFSPTSASIDVPTQARSNTTDTKFLYHFDNNVNDDVSIQHLGSAGLTSVSAVSATVGFITNAQSNISASSSVTATIGTLESIELEAFSNAAVTANANRLRGYNVACSSASSLSATAFRIKQLQANLTAAVSVVTTTDRLRDTAIALSTSVAVTAQGNAIRSGSAGIFANATVTAIIGRLHDINLVAFANGTTTAIAVRNAAGQSSITGSFTQSASAVKTAVSASAVTSENSLSVINTRLKFASASLSSQGSTLTLASEFQSLIANLNSRFFTAHIYIDDDYLASGYYEQFETTAVKTARGTAAFESVVTLVVGLTGSVFAVMTTSSQASVIATVVKRVSVSVTQALASSVNVVVAKTARGVTSISAVSTVVCIGNTTSEISLLALANANVSATVGVIRRTSIGLSSQATFFVFTQDSLNKVLEADFSSQLSTNIVAVKRVSAVIVTEAVASSLSVVVKAVAVLIPLDCSFTTTVTAVRIKQISSSQSAVTTVVTAAVKTARAQAAITASSTLTASVGKIVRAVIVTESVAITLTANIRIAGLVVQCAVASTLSVSGVRTRRAIATIVSQATFTVATVKLVSGAAAIVSVSSVSATVGVRKRFTAAITSAMVFVVEVRELRLDAIVYVIPAEGWSYRIEGETRNYTIISESRVKEIVGESRLHTINGESRIHII